MTILSMSVLTIFMTALFVVSAIIWALAAAARLIDRRVEQWPLLWATALWLCVIIPVLGVFLPLLFPHAVPREAVSLFSLHAPLQSAGLMTGGDIELSANAPAWDFTWIKSALGAFYMGGVVFTLAKLAWGRYRIRRLIRTASSAEITGQDDVLVSADVNAPLAYTPFGQPQDSRIVLPESYRSVVSLAQILDILTHERAHISRRDDECGLVLRVLLCLCWMSPFARGLFARWSQATEIQCDLAVTADRDPQMRKAYADTVLQALHIVADRVRQYPAASFSTQRLRTEKMRIRHIMDGTPPAFKRLRDTLVLGSVAAGVTLIGALAISTTATADTAEAPPSQNAPSEKTPAEKLAPEKTPSPSSIVPSIVAGKLTSKFGPALDPFKPGKTRNHYGIDIAAPTGTPIYAPADGVIRAATDAYNGNANYGNVVVLETQGGILTMFAHLEGYSVAPGQAVTQGTQIATVGSSGKSTGPHVHIETRKDGLRVDPEMIWTLRK